MMPSMQDIYAVCMLECPKNLRLSGCIKFYQKYPAKTLVSIMIHGIKKGQYGISIHEYGDISRGFHNLGDKYDNSYNFSKDGGLAKPMKKEHIINIPYEDMPSIIVEFIDDSIQLYGYDSIIGRSIVLNLRQNHPNLMTNRQFNLGESSEPILAWGVVGLSGPFEIRAPKLQISQNGEEVIAKT